MEALTQIAGKLLDGFCVQSLLGVDESDEQDSDDSTVSDSEQIVIKTETVKTSPSTETVELECDEWHAAMEAQSPSITIFQSTTDETKMDDENLPSLPPFGDSDSNGKQQRRLSLQTSLPPPIIPPDYSTDTLYSNDSPFPSLSSFMIHSLNATKRNKPNLNTFHSSLHPRKSRDSIEIEVASEHKKKDKADVDDGDNGHNTNKLNLLPFPSVIQSFDKLLRDFDWEKRGLIGSGGQAKVYMVVKRNQKNTNLNADIPQIVAIKVTPFDQIKENKLLHIFGGISTYKIYKKHELKYFVQDLVDVSLHDIIYNENSSLKRLKYEQREIISRSYIYQILSKIKMIHENGHLIHGDLKPENILIKKAVLGGNANVDDRVNIIDFGLSKQCKFGESIHAKSGYFFGTLGYSPPEMFKYKTERDYNHSIDIWAIGILCAEIIMLKNIIYFAKLNENAIYLKQKNRKYAKKSMFELQMRIYWEFIKKKDIKSEIIEHLKWEPNVFGIPGVSTKCIDFVTLCLQTDSNKRCTAGELLKHPWFKDIYKTAKCQ